MNPEATPETFKVICVKNYFFLSGSQKTANKIIKKRGIWEECL